MSDVNRHIDLVYALEYMEAARACTVRLRAAFEAAKDILPPADVMLLARMHAKARKVERDTRRETFGC